MDSLTDHVDEATAVFRMFAMITCASENEQHFDACFNSNDVGSCSLHLVHQDKVTSKVDTKEARM